MRNNQFLYAIFLMIFSTFSVASSITDVTFNELPSGQVEMTFQLDGTVPDPKIYAIENPARIALDLDGVSSALKNKKIPLNLSNAKSIMVLESGGRSRIIVNLVELSKYNAVTNGNTLILSLGNDVVSDYYVSGGKNQVPQTVSQNSSSASNSEISGIDFRRGSAGEGNIVVKLTNSNVDVDSRSEGGSIFLSFSDTVTPQDLKLKYDVSDFATPVSWMKASEKNGISTIEIRSTDYV